MTVFKEKVIGDNDPSGLSKGTIIQYLDGEKEDLETEILNLKFKVTEINSEIAKKEIRLETLKSKE